jgi:hypothetical protein
MKILMSVLILSPLNICLLMKRKNEISQLVQANKDDFSSNEEEEDVDAYEDEDDDS